MLPDPNFDIRSRRQPTATKRYLHNLSTNINDHKKESVYMYHVCRTPVFSAWTRLSRGKDTPRSRIIAIVSPPYRPTSIRVTALFVHKARYHSPSPFSVHIHARVGSATVIIRLLPRSTPVRFPARFYRPPAIHSFISSHGSGPCLPVAAPSGTVLVNFLALITYSPLATIRRQGDRFLYQVL